MEPRHAGVGLLRRAPGVDHPLSPVHLRREGATPCGTRCPAAARISDGLYIGEFVSFTGSPYGALGVVAGFADRVGTMTMPFTRGNAGSIAFTVDGSLGGEPHRAAGVLDPAHRMPGARR
ncbi:MAG: hypothetical protein IPJ28_05305 [Betaproteobacteria bacterium]|nr:hypothetical protein [Betaproteobacteria bacterium]